MSAEYSAEEVRARFEAAFGKCPEAQLTRNGDGYLFVATDHRWDGWQAAYAERIKADDDCDHRWVTDGFGPTTCAKCRRTSPPAQADEGAVMFSVPFGYAYRYADGIKLGGNGGERNGMRPIEAIALFTHPPAQAAQVDVKCSDCLGYGENCLAGHSAHPRNWYKCETCGGSGKAPTAEPAAQVDDAITEYYEDRNQTRSQGGFTHPRGVIHPHSPDAASPAVVPDDRLQKAIGALLWINEEVWPLVHGLTCRETLRKRFRELPNLIDYLAAAPSPGESS